MKMNQTLDPEDTVPTVKKEKQRDHGGGNFNNHQENQPARKLFHVMNNQVTDTPELFNCTNSALELYKCANCDFKTNLMVNFKEHVAETKFENTHFTCEYCGFGTCSLLVLMKHTNDICARTVPSTPTSQSFCCVVCYLLKEEFATHSFHEKLEIVGSSRPKPSLKNQVTKVRNTCFNVENYNSNEWLTGCESLSKLFCWSCLLFADGKSVWNESGVSDLNNFQEVIKKHAISEAHLHAVLRQKLFEKSHIQHTLDNRFVENNRKHNELVKKNREICKRLIDAVCSLSYQNQRCFLGLVECMAKYDATLRNCLEHSTILSDSETVRNDLIYSVATVVLEKIKQEVGAASFVAIVLEIIHTHPSIIVRYVKPDGKIQERFLGFLEVKTTAEALYKGICETVEHLECGSKLIAQSYDGGIVQTGQLECLQANVKDSFQSAIFVHCFRHSLNSVLSQSLMDIRECKTFVSTLVEIPNFFPKCSRRREVLDVEVQKSFPKDAPIRWDFNRGIVQTVFKYRLPIINFFENILECADDWNYETLHGSTIYLYAFEDFTFNFLLNVFSEISPFADHLFNILQNLSNSIELGSEMIEEFKNTINEKRNEFEKFWQKTVDIEDLAPEGQQSDNDSQNSYRKLFNKIIDHLTEQLNLRFINFDSLKFLELCNSDGYKNGSFPEHALECLKDNYATYFDMAALRSQLSVIYGTDKINKKNGASELLSFIKETGLEKSYSDVVKLCELVLTIPATGASIERNISTRIENFVRNSTSEEFCSRYSVFFLEKDLVKEVSESPLFYDDVICEFAKKYKKVELFYKKIE